MDEAEEGHLGGVSRRASSLSLPSGLPFALRTFFVDVKDCLVHGVDGDEVGKEQNDTVGRAVRALIDHIPERNGGIRADEVGLGLSLIHI